MPFLPRPCLLALPVLLALPTVGAAQDILTTDTVTLPHGKVTITHDTQQYTSTIAAAGTTLSYETGFRADVEAVIGDSALLFLPSGGNACPGEFVWITLDNTGLRASEAFGTCSDLAEVSETADGYLVTMPRFTPAGISGFLFDGAEVIESDLGLVHQGIAEPTDALSWIGYYATDLLSSAEAEPHLLALMDAETLEEVRNAAALTSRPLVQDGDWVVAIGCRPRLCDVESAGVAISVSTGNFLVVYWNRETGGALYGTPSGPLPAQLTHLLANGL